MCGERLAESSIFHCGDAYATVVSVDQHGLPVDIPFDLQPKDAADVSRCAAATIRHVPCCRLIAWLVGCELSCVCGCRRDERLAMREALLLTQFARRSLDGRLAG